MILLTLSASLAGFRPPPRRNLVVVLAVDQLRPDYLLKWRAQWTGGFRRLLEQGAYFPNGLQDHAATETAPGHATILSGRNPAHTGIVLNAVGVQDSLVTLIGGAASTGASPRRFIGSTLVDWLARRDSLLRTLSVARKDRSAIFMVGRSRSPVYWYERGFTTSTWYADSLPDWVTQWNARRGPERLAGASWNLLLPDSAYPEPDNQPWEHRGRFPHTMPADSARAMLQVDEFPWIDSLTLDLALDGVRALGLGRRRQPDLLAVGLSATDHMGHEFGPNSRELHDHLLRLDRWLGWFLDSLATTTPRERILLVLTADHGVTPFPEEAREAGRQGGRVGLGRLVAETNRDLGAAGALRESSGLIYGDTAGLRAARVNPESLATVLTARVQRLPGVKDAWSPATLGAPLSSNVDAARWRRSLSPKLSWLVCAALRPGYIWADGVGSTTHGTTNPDDVGVPIAFLGSGIPSGVFPDTVRTIDIAPTLARLLDVNPTEKLDGRRIKRIAN